MPRIPGLDPLYAVFAAFLERCLVQDRSLLWPEREVWTIAALEEARRRFVEGYFQGRMSFRAKLEAQLGGAAAEVWALIADCFYIYGLPSRSILAETSRGWVEWAAGQARQMLPGLVLPPADDPLWQALRMGFAVTGQKYNFKHAQLRLLILLALEVKAAGDSPAERAALVRSPEAMQAALDSILESIPLRLDRAYDMRNAILHMAFPEQYEPVLSNREKDAILGYYAGLYAPAGDPPADRDRALRLVREALEPRLGQGFDFYGPAREEWRPAGSALENALAGLAVPEAGPGLGGVRERPAEWQSPADPDVLRALAALRITPNVILSGPPGTGKTYIARQTALRLVEGQGAAPEHFLYWVTLHPSYAYEDFVEGLRPALAPGAERASAVTYEVRPGVLREAAGQAAADPAHTYVLVLDEINRANLAKILGELVTLIEEDKRGLFSARLPYSGLAFSVPPNLLLLGTMNTADRSIALLDAALRRRFAFVEVGPRADLLAGAQIETEEAVLRLDTLLECLNEAIREHLGADHQLGHSYFLRVARTPASERLALLELAWNTQVLPLLEEYFYTQRDRLLEILAPFVEESREGGATRAIARLSGEELVVALSRLCGR